MHLALDHLTVSDAYPWEVIDLAAANRLQGVCLFLHAMDVIVPMPAYDLITDVTARQRTRKALDDTGVSLDLVYPFTLTGRSRAKDFAPAITVAAELGAKAINLLVYDRDEPRRIEAVGAVADLAAVSGLEALIEFYPASAVKDLASATTLVQAVARKNLGLNLDILHLYRSGGAVSDVEAARPWIRFAQLADAPHQVPEHLDYEAGRARLNIGEGDLAVSEFIAALPQDVPISLEVPRDEDILCGLSQAQRADRAVSALKTFLAEAR